MLWYFQVRSKGTQPYICMYPFSPHLPSPSLYLSTRPDRRSEVESPLWSQATSVCKWRQPWEKALTLHNLGPLPPGPLLTKKETEPLLNSYLRICWEEGYVTVQIFLLSCRHCALSLFSLPLSSFIEESDNLNHRLSVSQMTGRRENSSYRK